MASHRSFLPRSSEEEHTSCVSFTGAQKVRRSPFLLRRVISSQQHCTPLGPTLTPPGSSLLVPPACRCPLVFVALPCVIDLARRGAPPRACSLLFLSRFCRPTRLSCLVSVRSKSSVSARRTGSGWSWSRRVEGFSHRVEISPNCECSRTGASLPDWKTTIPRR